MEQLNSYCGYDCTNCPLYKSTKEENKINLNKVLQSGDTKIKNNSCNGCKSDFVIDFCNKCNVKHCCIEKRIENCGFCNIFPCTYVKTNLSSESLNTLNKINQFKNIKNK